MKMKNAPEDMVDMKRPPGNQMAMPVMEGDEHYGYGLVLRLENHELDALKLAMPQVGKEFMIMACGKVTSVHESRSAGNKGDRGVTIQITDMKIR